MNLMVYDWRKKKDVIAGEIQHDMFIKTVKKNHYMGKYRGYGISEEVFKQLVDTGIKNITIRGKHDILTSISKWIQEGIVANEGSGPQRFLALPSAFEEPAI